MKQRNGYRYGVIIFHLWLARRKVMSKEINKAFYREFYDRAMMGEIPARVLLIHRYVSPDYEMPDYCNEYVERFILNVAHEVGHGNSIPSRLFPDNPKRKSSFWKRFEISGFVYRKVVNEGMTIPAAKELACDEFGVDTRAIEKNIKSAIEYQKENPDFLSVSIEERIGSGNKR